MKLRIGCGFEGGPQLVRGSKGIARSRTNEHGRRDELQVGLARFIRLSRWMERIGEANQGVDRLSPGHHVGGRASTHGTAANCKSGSVASGCCDRAPPGCLQQSQAIRKMLSF